MQRFLSHTCSGQDNYVHGLVINDYKFSETKEVITDLTRTLPFAGYDYTNTTSDLNSVLTTDYKHKKVTC